MKDFDYSFSKLLAWAFQTGLLPDEFPIPLQEITLRFNHRFKWDIFFKAALKENLLGPNPTDVELTDCWYSLTDEQRQGYAYKPSSVLIEELPRLADDVARPEWCSLMVGPRSSLSAYELLIEVVSRLWPNPNKFTDDETAKGATLAENCAESNRIEVQAQRITLFDSVYVPAGSQMPERITFRFGADGPDVTEDETEDRLFDRRK